MTLDRAEYQSLVLPKTHDDFCNCRQCHAEHSVKRNAVDWPLDFRCCVEEIEENPIVEFIGKQKTDISGVEFSLFNVYGVRGLANGTTVGLVELLDRGIKPDGFSDQEIKDEFNSIQVYGLF